MCIYLHNRFAFKIFENLFNFFRNPLNVLQLIKINFMFYFHKYEKKSKTPQIVEG